MHDIQNKVLFYDIKEKKLKVVSLFSYDSKS